MKDVFLAFEGVRKSGYYNMFDPRARQFAEEVNDMTISREDWAECMKKYSEYKSKWLSDEV